MVYESSDDSILADVACPCCVAPSLVQIFHFLVLQRSVVRAGTMDTFSNVLVHNSCPKLVSYYFFFAVR